VADVTGRGYETPLQVWKQIKGMTLPKQKRIFLRGHAMEPFMTERVREFGRKLVAEQVQYRDPERPWLLYHTDGMFPEWTPLDPDSRQQDGPGICEWKAPGAEMAAHMAREGLSNTYIVQMQTGMHVASRALDQQILWGTAGFWDYDNWDLVAFDISRNERFIQDTLQMVDFFWSEYVVKDVPPPDGKPADLVDMSDVQVKGELEIVTEGRLVELAEQWVALQDELGPLAARDKELRAAMKKEAVGLSCAEVGGLMKFTYRQGNDTVSYDGEALFAWARGHFRTVKSGSRSFRPTVIKE